MTPSKPAPLMELLKTDLKSGNDSDAVSLLLCTLCRIVVCEPYRDLLSQTMDEADVM